MRRSGFDIFARLAKPDPERLGAQPSRTARPNHNTGIGRHSVGVGRIPRAAGGSLGPLGQSAGRPIHATNRTIPHRVSSRSRGKTGQSDGQSLRQTFVQKEYDRLEFDTDGLHEKSVSILHPFDAAIAFSLSERAKKKTIELYPNVNPHNNEADAFRHAYWSFLMTRRLGADRAKQFADAHERYGTDNGMGEKLMDLHNNLIGRILAAVRENELRDPVEVIK